MKWIGLTGCIGCGKSTVAALLKNSYGFPVISADAVALQILKQDKDLHLFVRQNLSLDVMRYDLSTEEGFSKYRNDIASKVFLDQDLLKKYEGMIHPKVKMQVLSLRQNLSKTHQFAIYDVPLLFEKKMQRDFDLIVGVFSNRENQIQRLRRRTGWDDKKILDRVNHQLSNEDKISQCNYVISNDSTFEALQKAVDKFVLNLTGGNSNVNKN